MMNLAGGVGRAGSRHWRPTTSVSAPVWTGETAGASLWASTPIDVGTLQFLQKRANGPRAASRDVCFTFTQQPGQLCRLQSALVRRGIEEHYTRFSIDSEYNRPARLAKLLKNFARIVLQFSNGFDVLGQADRHIAPFVEG
jgi:hypothetical protein